MKKDRFMDDDFGRIEIATNSASSSIDFRPLPECHDYAINMCMA
jgi:hypothetical protein